jgi:hypothetical protein
MSVIWGRVKCFFGYHDFTPADEYSCWYCRRCGKAESIWDYIGQ